MWTPAFTWLGMEPPWVWVLVNALLHLALFLLVCWSCLRTRRESTAALLWMFVAWSFPLIGPLLYLMFGINRVPRKAWRKQRADRELRTERQARAREDLPLVYWRAVHEALAAQPDTPAARSLNRTLDAVLPDYPLLGGNAIAPLLDGDEAYPRMLEAIRSARHHIHLQTFILWQDDVSREFMDALAARARAGVAVRCLYDRFGSTGAVLGRLFPRYRRVPNLQIAGWTQANLLKRQVQINLRNHRKILIVDGERAFTGGINIRRENRSRPGAPAIRDYHVAVRGPIVQELQFSFLRDWYFMTDEDPDVLLQAAHFPRLPAVGPARIRVANSGPTTDELECIARVVFESLAAARRQVLLVTPYFVPPREILEALYSAARRGVDVRLIVPRRNNHIYAGLAGQSLYGDLLDAGIRIVERPPPFMHAKALIVDDWMAMIGSANLDARSLRLNYETNLVIFDAEFIRALTAIVRREDAIGIPLDAQTWRRRPAPRRLLENACYLMMPVL